MASPEFAKTHPGTLKELASLPLISDSHSYWQTLLASHNLPKPSRLLQFNQTALAMDAASNGQGIALAPALLVADDVARGKLLVVWQQNSDDDRGFYLVHRRKAKANPSRETVKAWLKTQAQSA